ncbi:MAG TPA: outer membrane lipoprotein carrier protein LolA [Candidatus Limnocylindrales bacterium]|nr:outer membrane lipoprotein carrier protein LolA [Candidatus Limnocylindrales bacterium]
MDRPNRHRRNGLPRAPLCLHASRLLARASTPLRVVALAILLSAAPAAMLAAGAEQAQTLSALMEGMRSTTGVVAQFEETKHLALLSQPLVARGTVYFVPPDRLVREVSSPGRSRLVVDGDKVVFEDETGRNAMNLSGSPMARQMIDSFVVLFNGDEKRLHELYDVQFSADAGTWKLRLVPRSMPLSRMVASFEMTGRQARIDRMEMAEPDGDRTTTVFGTTDSSHRFTAEELKKLFGEDPAS